jgi:TonB family protein
MKLIAILPLIFAGSAFGTQPMPVTAPAIRAPADACFGTSGVCVATVSFVVLPDGKVSDVSIEESSSDRACDLAVNYGVAKWRYAPRASSIRIIKQVQGYTCPAHEAAANHSFEADGYAAAQLQR